MSVVQVEIAENDDRITRMEENRLNVINELIGGFFFTIVNTIINAKNGAITKRSVDDAANEIGCMN